MTTDIIEPLNVNLRVLRTLQCPYHIQPNDEGNAYRPSSGAFIPGKDQTFSVDLEQSLNQAGLAVDARFGLLPNSITIVAHVLSLYNGEGYSVTHTPIEGVNPHHGSVATIKRNNQLRKAARAMADSATFLIEIDRNRAVSLGAAPLKVAAGN